ncbi:hypothetical protein [Succinimonas sp.]|uniref:hypothetical protein n=1 Tax=Succinimonas sp. TaxID=1936151 RepID=UPI0038643407
MNIRETLSCLSIIRAAARASGTGFFSIENTPALPLSASAMETMVMGLSRVFDPAGLISRDAAMGIAVSVLKRKLGISSGSYPGIRISKTVIFEFTPVCMFVWPSLHPWGADDDRGVIKEAGWDIAREFALRAALAKVTAGTACFE